MASSLARSAATIKTKDRGKFELAAFACLNTGRPNFTVKFKNFDVNLAAKRKGKMNEDENLAAPKWMELDAEEKILCEFELVHTIHKEVRAALCIFYTRATRVLT